MAKRTALYEEHVKLGGRIIDFGGWDLPVQYEGLMAEHTACRTACGLFDVSHMGEIFVSGPKSEDFLDYLVSNQVTKLAVGQAQYNLMCNSAGGIVDDLVVYRLKSDLFLLVVNASNSDKDFNHIQMVHKDWSSRSGFSLNVSNQSQNFSQIAVQGRHAEKIIQKLTAVSLSDIKYYWFKEGMLNVGEDVPTIFSRTGYTGEDGFELYIPWAQAPIVWRALLETGKPFGIKPCGLGARDTLRLEMKFPLYGNELGDNTNPLEAGVGWITKLSKSDFLGKSAILAKKTAGLTHQSVGIKGLDRAISRHGYKVFDSSGTTEIGEVTSGTQSPSLKYSIAVASVQTPFSEIGTKITIDVRGTKTSAKVVSTPFYKRDY